jgi:hypothetical protein
VARGLRIDVDGLRELGADLREFERRLPLAIRASLRGDGGGALATEMKMRAPSRSGTLRSGIGVYVDGDGAMVGYRGAAAKFSGVAGARDQRGAWVESGTKPHTIRAKNGGALLLGGKFVEEVHHPGSRGQGVAQKSIRSAKWEVLADVVDQLDRIA